MIIDLLAVAIPLIIVFLLAKPAGLYIASTFSDKETKVAKFFKPAERLLFKLGGVEMENQSWKKYAWSLVLTNTVMILIVYLIFRFQGILPLNPTGIKGMTPDLAFNTAVSFMTNTNLQHYSGESGLSLLSQMAAILFMMFAAPATALAAAIAMIRGLAGQPIGNFFVDLVKGITRILIPVAVVAGIVFIFLGMPQTLDVIVKGNTPDRGIQTILRGPVGSFLSIKEFGNNGGGFFGVNSAHPFENPNGLTNAIQIILMLLLPASLPFTYGKMVGNSKQGRVLFVSMLMMFIVFLGTSLFFEIKGTQY